MLEFDLSLESTEAFEDLRSLLLRAGCRVNAEEPPTLVSAKQGSLWGVAPKTAKKNIECRLLTTGSKTHVIVSSSLSSDWKNLTIYGTILSAAVAAVCLWIFVDLHVFASTLQPSVWSWLVARTDYTNVQATIWLANLAGWLGAFLYVAVALEVICYIYASKKIDLFAKETLKRLTDEQKTGQLGAGYFLSQSASST